MAMWHHGTGISRISNYSWWGGKKVYGQPHALVIDCKRVTQSTVAYSPTVPSRSNWLVHQDIDPDHTSSLKMFFIANNKQ